MARKLGLLLGTLLITAVISGSKPKSEKPTLWVFTAPEYCIPCRHFQDRYTAGSLLRRKLENNYHVMLLDPAVYRVWREDRGYESVPTFVFSDYPEQGVTGFSTETDLVDKLQEIRSEQ